MRGEAPKREEATPHPSALTPRRKTIQVACGVLVNAVGEVLLAQRPVGKIAAGYWEFPGGKIELGESALQALTRELHEELGVELRQARPLMRYTHHYTDRSVLLDTWLVSEFSGEPRGREQQAFAWLPPSQLLHRQPLLPTVAPIALALSLPLHYVFTLPNATIGQLLAGLAALPAGALLRLRLPLLSDDEYADAAAQIIPPARQRGLRAILDRAPELVMRLGADGWHASSAVLMQLAERPALALCLASVHNAAELAHAQALGIQAAVLGPVLATATHPGVSPLGWDGFAAIASGAALPVYALGGVGAAHLPSAHAVYAQGVAGISAYWAAPSSD